MEKNGSKILYLPKSTRLARRKRSRFVLLTALRLMMNYSSGSGGLVMVSQKGSITIIPGIRGRGHLP